jgi:hypothetical protein
MAAYCLLNEGPRSALESGRAITVGWGCGEQRRGRLQMRVALKGELAANYRSQSDSSAPEQQSALFLRSE